MTTESSRRVAPAVLLLALISAAAVAIGAAVWIASGLDEDSAGPEKEATLQQVTEDPRSFVGETVTVSGDVAATHRRPHAFAIGDDTRRPMLVLLPPGRAVRSWPDPDDVARVTGTVRIFSFAEYAQGLDELDRAGDDAFFGGFEGDAAIVAQRIEVLDEGTTSPMLGDQP